MCKARRKRWVFICANMKALLKEQKKLEKKLTPKQRKISQRQLQVLTRRLQKLQVIQKKQLDNKVLVC